MKRLLAVLALCTLLGVLLLGCGPELSPQPGGSTPAPQTTVGATPTPCATLPPLAGVATVSAYPGERSTPSALQPTFSPQQLATMEAIVAGRNRPGPTLPAGQPGAPALPWCATPTPVK